MMYPKPKIKSKRPLNNPKPTEDSLCKVCGRPYAETHEIFFGKYRQKSIHYGMQIPLCDEHHRGPDGPHQSRKRDLELKRRGQIVFEYFWSHEEFMREFGRNYL